MKTIEELASMEKSARPREERIPLTEEERADWTELLAMADQTEELRKKIGQKCLEILEKDKGLRAIRDKTPEQRAEFEAQRLRILDEAKSNPRAMEILSEVTIETGREVMELDAAGFLDPVPT